MNRKLPLFDVKVMREEMKIINKMKKTKDSKELAKLQKELDNGRKLRKKDK